jgi:SAM-dependent methyltransferase
MKRAEEKWDSFAKTAPEFYILTEEGVDYSTEEGRRHFFETGEALTAEWLGRAREFLRRQDRAVEIGCGIGRLTIPHARHFGEVRGVDISPVMLQRLREEADGAGLRNISAFTPNENWDEPESCDYAYSFIVFQHLEHMEEIAAYIQRLARTLKVGGVAQLQFDTRPRSFGYRARNLLPDLLLPRTQRRGIRRIRRDPRQLVATLRREGLESIGDFNPGTEIHTYLLRKTSVRN